MTARSSSSERLNCAASLSGTGDFMSWPGLSATGSYHQRASDSNPKKLPPGSFPVKRSKRDLYVVVLGVDRPALREFTAEAQRALRGEAATNRSADFSPQEREWADTLGTCWRCCR